MTPAHKATAPPPHIVFVLSDQHNPLVIHSHGDPYVRTPNLDRLTEGGTALANCYCPSPLCVPSRSAMLSGLLPHRTGIYTNFQALRSDQATFVHALGAAGYHTVLAGRMHFVGPDQRHGYAQRLVGDITPSTVGIRHDNYGVLAGTPGQNRAAVEKSGAGRSAVLQYDAAVLDAACIRLRAHVASTQPLFLTVGFYAPHCPYVCPRELYDHYYQTPPRLAPEDDFKRTVHPAVDKWYQNRGITDVDPEAVHRSRAAYYGLVEMTDRYVGHIYNTVADTIGLENTLFVYASDHGDMIGDKGLFWKSNMYDGSARVPAIFHWPGVVGAGVRVTGLTSLLDLAPTLIELSGAPQLPLIDGQSLVPQLTCDMPIDPDRAVIAMCGDLKGDMPSAMIRRGPWKLVDHHSYDAPQLFHMQDDPGERVDLGRSLEHADIRRALYRELDQVWDGKAVHEHVQRVAAHVRLRRAFNVATGTQYPDDWHGDPDDNYYE